ncbi:unnamed protein product [Prunus armeniaca]
METKQKHNRLSKLGKEMGFPYDYYVDPVGLLEVYALLLVLMVYPGYVLGITMRFCGRLKRNKVGSLAKINEGPDFTWSGRKGDGFVVQERLDRALIDVAW